MSEEGYHYRAFCDCGFHIKAPAGSVFLAMANEPCPKCGKDSGHFTVRNVRWVSTGILWRPSTWGSGYWEEFNNE